MWGWGAGGLATGRFPRVRPTAPCSRCARVARPRLAGNPRPTAQVTAKWTLGASPDGPVSRMLPTAATSGLGRGELVRGGQVEVAVVASEALSDERRRRAAEHGRLAPGASPAKGPRRNPAENASPQPVVSTTSTSKAGTSSLPSRVDDQRALGSRWWPRRSRRLAPPGTGIRRRDRPRRSGRAPGRRSAAGSRARAKAGAIQSTMSRACSPGARMSADVVTPWSRAKDEDPGRRLAAHELRPAEMQVGGCGDRVPGGVVGPVGRVGPDEVESRSLTVRPDGQDGRRGRHVVAADEV